MEHTKMIPNVSIWGKKESEKDQDPTANFIFFYFCVICGFWSKFQTNVFSQYLHLLMKNPKNGKMAYSFTEPYYLFKRAKALQSQTNTYSHAEHWPKPTTTKTNEGFSVPRTLWHMCGQAGNQTGDLPIRGRLHTSYFDSVEHIVLDLGM